MAAHRTTVDDARSEARSDDARSDDTRSDDACTGDARTESSWPCASVVIGRHLVVLSLSVRLFCCSEERAIIAKLRGIAIRPCRDSFSPKARFSAPRLRCAMSH